MSEEPTTPDLVGLARRLADAWNRRDLDTAMSFLAPDAVFDVQAMGKFEGTAAIRGFLQDWPAAYEDLVIDVEKGLDLGNGIVFLISKMTGRPAGSRAEVRTRVASVSTYADGVFVRVTNYNDIDAARAAAERLGEERG